MGSGEGYFTNYPKHVFFILGNEFCERFSFYGMKAILVLFLKQALGFQESVATSIYHGFNMVCYFMPIFGAMIADGFLGKYKTILIISVVYCIGNVVMAIGSIPLNGSEYISALPFIGLLLIGTGTGGIKPCVSAFGADQFEDDQPRQKQTFFSLFYMAINVGSFLSMIVTPMIRSNVECFGNSCYPLAFGIPAILMLVAVACFILGTRWYKITPPGENIIAKLFGCIGTALKGKCCCSKQERREHWLDHADSAYSEEFIRDVKGVMRVLYIFIPLPIFYCLFDQQGSRWVFQAGQMDGDFGSFVLQPDQIQVLNSVLILCIVPFLESVIFPCMDRYNLPNRPLQRLGFGMFLAGTAFLIAAFLQMVIDNNLPKAVPVDLTRFKLINSAPCHLQVHVDGSHLDLPDFNLNSNQASDDQEVLYGNLTFQVTLTECSIGTDRQMAKDIDLSAGTYYSVLVSGSSTSEVSVTEFQVTQTTRTDNGKATIDIINTLPKPAIVRIDKNSWNISSLGSSGETVVPNSDLDMEVDYEGQTETGMVSTKAGAAFTIVLHNTSGQVSFTQYQDISANNINIFLMVPQYFVMALGEAFFSVTGLSFAYSQAPASMKAVLQAAWLLNNSLGNCIVMIITAVGHLPSQFQEFLLFSGLMYVTVIIFTIMSMFFTYADHDVDVGIVRKSESESMQAYDNVAMELDEAPPTVIPPASMFPASRAMRRSLPMSNGDVAPDILITHM